MRGLRAPAVLSRLRLCERIALSPEGYTLDELLRLTRSLFDAGQRLFVMSMHSPSIVPGHTPYVRDEAGRRELLSRLDRYFHFFRRELKGVPTDPLAELQAFIANPDGKRPVAVAAVSPMAALKRRPPVVRLEPITDDDLPEVVSFWHDNLNRTMISHAIWKAGVRASLDAGETEQRLHDALRRPAGRHTRRDLLGTTDRWRAGQFLQPHQPGAGRAVSRRGLDGPVGCVPAAEAIFVLPTSTPTAGGCKNAAGCCGFAELNTDEYIVPHLPVPPKAVKLEVLTQREQFDQRLTGNAARLWRDHHDIKWLNRFAVGKDDAWCMVFWKPATVRGWPGAVILGVSDTSGSSIEWNRAIGGHFLAAARAVRQLAARPPAARCGAPFCASGRGA